MKRFTCQLAFGLLAALPAVADVDLTPRSVNIGGGLIQRAYFTDGDRQFAVTIDSETELSGENGVAIFRFTNVSQASMTLRPSPFKKPAPFTADTLPDYIKAAMAMLPAASEGVEITSQAANALPINDWKSYRLVFRYQVGGVGYDESITYLVLESGQQIVIQTGAQRKDFPAVAERADDTFRRWHLVTPEDEAGIN